MTIMGSVEEVFTHSARKMKIDATKVMRKQATAIHPGAVGELIASSEGTVRRR